MKFFRSIRKIFLNENKFHKYIVYALGEVFLIVIGILIALQIDNWHDNNQAKDLEVKYLNEIKNYLKLDLKDIELNIEGNLNKRESNQIVLKHLTKDLDYSDSLSFHLSNIIGSTRSIANMSAYENLKSRGLEIISNDSLRKNITYLYSTVYHNIIDFEFQDDHRHQYEVLWPEVINAVIIKSMWEDAEPINYEELKNNHSFKNALSTNIFLRDYMIKKYKGLKLEVEKLIVQIENELENK